MREVYGRLLAGLFSELCPRCGLASAGGFCVLCRADFIELADPCELCALAGPRHTCPAAASGWQIDSITAPFAYAPPLSRWLQQMKFGRRRPLGRCFGLLLADRIAGRAARVDAIVAVPLHGSRLRQRGFNQADEIGRTLAAALGLPQQVRGIARSVATRPQSDLELADRLANVRSAFRVRCDLGGRRLAIVDDVVTTGATINALALALRRAGAERVDAWAVARTTAPA